LTTVLQALAGQARMALEGGDEVLSRIRTLPGAQVGVSLHEAHTSPCRSARARIGSVTSASRIRTALPWYSDRTETEGCRIARGQPNTVLQLAKSAVDERTGSLRGPSTL
jgi:hypothetical protein